MFSKNRTLIYLSQLLSRIAASRRSKTAASHPPEPVLGIRDFCEGEPQKRAMICLSPAAWRDAVAQYPDIRFFNVAGFTWQVVRAFNQRGYEVDIFEHRAANVPDTSGYSLSFVHGPHMRAVIDRLPKNCFVLHYCSGAYWREFNRMSRERYDAFCSRKGIPPIRDFERSLGGLEDGEDYIIKRCDASFCSGPRTTATYGPLAEKMELLYLAAQVEADLLCPDRDFAAGRQNFIYVAGTGGNIQKGLDVLLEAFSRTPELHLYIYCKVEPEVSKVYDRELSLHNVHYIYHLSRTNRKKLRNILRRINFTVSAPIDTGPGTAMLGSLGLGLIPVGYIDIEATESDSVLCDDPSVDSVIAAIRGAAAQTPEWCRNASLATLERFERLHQPESFGRNFKAYLKRLGL